MFLSIHPSEREVTKQYAHIPEERREKKTEYKNSVNVKPWGHEFLIYESDKIGIWVLHINKNQATSVHCHFQKDTMVFNLSGVVVVNMHDEKDNTLLQLMQSVYIPKGKFHGFTSLSEDTILLEIEVFNDNVSFSDKNDLLRLKDVYARSEVGYESSVLRLFDNTSLERYGVFYLDLISKHYVINNFVSCMLHTDISRTLVHVNRPTCHILIEGKIRDAQGRILKEGSIIPDDEVQQLSESVLVLDLYRENIEEDRKIITDLHELKLVTQGLTGKQIVLTSGCFDIIHTGHMHHLRKAKAEGDILMVCLSNDEQIRSLKGSLRPVNSYKDRIDLLKVIPYVDYIVLYNEEDTKKESTLDNIMRIVNPDTWTKGNDYTEEQIRMLHPCLKRIHIIPNLLEKSTTNIIHKAKRT